MADADLIGEDGLGWSYPHRLLLLPLLFAGCYLAYAAFTPSVAVQPWLLLGAVVVGALGGVGAAFWQRRRASRRLQRIPPSTGARSVGVTALAGCGLLLAQVLPDRAVMWFMIGAISFAVALPVHAVWWRPAGRLP